MKIALALIIAILILGVWLPILPFPVKGGFHGRGGEWCGVVYNASCDRTGIRFLTYKQIGEVIQSKAY